MTCGRPPRSEAGANLTPPQLAGTLGLTFPEGEVVVREGSAFLSDGVLNQLKALFRHAIKKLEAVLKLSPSRTVDVEVCDFSGFAFASEGAIAKAVFSHRSALHIHWLLAQPIHSLELLFGELLKGRHLHVDGRLELNAQLLPSMATPDSCDHLPSFVVIGVDGEMPRRTHRHKCFATALTIAAATE